MKKITTFLLTFMLLITTGWSTERKDLTLLREIHCFIRPIHHNKIHPQQTASLPPTTGTVDSSNWSGYVAAPNFQHAISGSVTSVNGSWTVPTLIATKDTTYCAIWVGIDGFLDHTVEQIGTSHNWEKGAQKNYAWFEMYPHYAYEISGFPVNKGDLIEATVKYIATNTFQMTLYNHTKRVKTTIPTTYTRAVNTGRNSAEWIIEAPYSGSILPLSDFKVTGINNCSTTIKGITGPINAHSWMNDMIIMENGTTIKALPSALQNNGTSFNVVWEHE